MKGKGKVKIALLYSILSLIICFLIELAIFNYIYSSFKFRFSCTEYIAFLPFILFPFCVAFFVFYLCYSGKLYIFSGVSALIVSVLLSPVLLMFYNEAVSVYDENCHYLEHRNFDNTRAIPITVAELNGRENRRWAQLKKGDIQFQTDAEIDREIVTGTTGGGWNTDLGADFTWTVAPTAAGGTISFLSYPSVTLTRTAATLNSPATWY